MGKPGKKTRKFSKKNLQPVLRRRGNYAFLSKKKSYSKNDGGDVEDKPGNTLEHASGSHDDDKDVNASLDAVFRKDDSDVFVDISYSDGCLSEDSSYPKIAESAMGDFLEEDGDEGELSLRNKEIHEELSIRKKKLDPLHKDPDFVKFLQSSKDAENSQTDDNKKKRELKAAGYDVPQDKKGKRIGEGKRMGSDYSAEIPFEKGTPIDFYEDKYDDSVQDATFKGSTVVAFVYNEGTDDEAVMVGSDTRIIAGGNEGELKVFDYPDKIKFLGKHMICAFSGQTKMAIEVYQILEKRFRSHHERFGVEMSPMHAATILECHLNNFLESTWVNDCNLARRMGKPEPTFNRDLLTFVIAGWTKDDNKKNKPILVRVDGRGCLNVEKVTGCGKGAERWAVPILMRESRVNLSDDHAATMASRAICISALDDVSTGNNLVVYKLSQNGYTCLRDRLNIRTMLLRGYGDMRNMVWPDGGLPSLFP